MKDHEKREIINAVTAIAINFSGTQQLRERISEVLLPILNDSIDLTVPKWAAEEICQTWNAVQGKGQLESFRIIERMVDRLGYGRIENNPKGF